MTAAEIKIREASESDLPAVIDRFQALYTYLETLDTPFQLSREGLERILPTVLKSPNCLLAVAESPSSGICGFIYAAVSRMDRKLEHPGGVLGAKVHDYYVDEACRGMGLGRSLLEYAKDWSRNRGAAFIEAEIIKGNVASEEAMKRAGLLHCFSLVYAPL